MNTNEKIFPRKTAPEKSARMVETIYGCKWSLTVYQLLANNINRPGEMVKSVDGLLSLHKDNKPYDPVNVFVSDETGNKIPLVKLDIELELLGTGLYVSEKNYVFSDPEACITEGSTLA